MISTSLQNMLRRAKSRESSLYVWIMTSPALLSGALDTHNNLRTDAASMIFARQARGTSAAGPTSTNRLDLIQEGLQSNDSEPRPLTHCTVAVFAQ